MCRAVINSSVKWCGKNNLQLNVAKTKKMVVDIRRSKSMLTPASIFGKDMEVVESYRYLGVHLDNKLDWTLRQSTRMDRADFTF